MFQGQLSTTQKSAVNFPSFR